MPARVIAVRIFNYPSPRFFVFQSRFEKYFIERVALVGMVFKMVDFERGGLGGTGGLLPGGCSAAIWRFN